MRFIIILSAILFSALLPANAQMLISGKTLDASSEEPVPFVNIGIEGTATGTTSDSQGRFRLEIPNRLSRSNIRFSSLGYDDKSISAAELLKSEDNVIRLNPQDYDIEEVVVEDKSYFPYLILRRAADSIRMNYPQTAYNYRMFYESRLNYHNNEQRQRSALVQLYDAEGYGKRNFQNAYSARNYRFEYSKRNFEVRTPESGNTFLDELLKFDFVRRPGNILDKHHSSTFEVKRLPDTLMGQDSAWVLEYRCQSPDLRNTGFYYAQSYSGKIYISKDRYAVLKNTLSGQLSLLSLYGSDLYVAPSEKTQHLQAVHFSINTEYKPRNDRYVLSNITYRFRAEKAAAGAPESAEIAVRLLEFTDKNPQVIEQRDYFENLIYDAAFWSTFNSEAVPK